MSNVYVFALVERPAASATTMRIARHRIEFMPVRGIYAAVERRRTQPRISEASLRGQHDVVVKLARRCEAILPVRFGAWVDEQITPPSGWQGFTGIRGIFDEWDPNGTIWAHYEWPETFTPEEFNRLWDGFTERRKIDYVLSLIT